FRRVLFRSQECDRPRSQQCPNRNRTFRTLCRATASSISRKVRLASSTENLPMAPTLRKPGSGDISSFILIWFTHSEVNWVTSGLRLDLDVTPIHIHAKNCS